MKAARIAIAAAAIAGATAIAATAGLHDKSTAAVPPAAPEVYRVLPTESQSYLGVYVPPVPASYAGVTSFMRSTGVTPDVVMYYSGWQEPFQASFAKTVAKHGAVPLVQIEPTGVSLAAIASGRYDGYLTSYADAVVSYGSPVILSFAHEMNGSWYSWGYRHSSPAEFVAAWRHIVHLFRIAGARNVTWLWTVNVTSNARHSEIPSPAQWWPGSMYVTWVGIDGYYLGPSYRFTSLFGPTITLVRELTNDPILISETGAAQATGQPAKISDLAAGIRTYGLLGFVWFDSQGAANWRISSPAAIAALHDAATAYKGSAK